MTRTEPAPTPAIDDETRPSAWLAVASLGLGVFTLVAGEFLPASLLSVIAADLRVTEGLAGQAVTATALMGAITGLTLTSVFPRMDRRRLLLGLAAASVLSNLLVAVAPNVVVLLAARLLFGIAVAGFWSMALAVTAQLVPLSKLGRAMTVINTGVSIATVAAVPLGTLLGELWGWRWVFVAAAGVGVLVMVAQAVLLPAIAPSPGAGIRTIFDTARSRIIAIGLVALLLIPGGHFMGFTYLRPGVERASDLDATGLSMLLLLFGVAGFIGNLVSGPLADRRLRVAVVLFPVVLGLSMLAFAITAGALWATIIAVATWGFAFGGVPTIVQTWFARARPDRLEAIGGLVVTMFQVAIASGAAIGGLIVDGADVRIVFMVGGTAALVGGVLLGAVRLRS